MVILAATAAALACWLLLPPEAGRRLRDREGQRSGRGDRPVAGRLWPVLAVAAVVSVAGGLAGSAGAVTGFAVALPLVTAVLVWRQHRRQVSARESARQVSGACQLLAGLVRLGHVPASALRLAAREAPVLAEAAAMLDIGSAPGPVLRRLGQAPGRSGLAELGIAWDVAERTGASLTASLDALAERLTARQRVDDVVAAELSAPRATGRLLAVLPVAGVVLGYAFGGDPLRFLGGSPAGQASLAVGVVLACAGVWWTERIAGMRGS